MCNRFRASRPLEEIEDQFQAWDQIEHVPRFNVAPTQPIVTVRQESGRRRLANMRWGLIPSWATAISSGNFNARSESVNVTPSFRNLIYEKRCLIPADAFYEWNQMGTIKQPFCFEVGDGALFAFAGLWDEWKNPHGEKIQSCTILTTAANELVGEVHDRMPVIVSLENYEVWLHSEDENVALALLKPYDAKAMRRYAVSPKLNNSKNDSAELAAALEIEMPIQAKLF